MASKCGECLMNDVEIVELAADGKCPRCGSDYGKPIAHVCTRCGIEHDDPRAKQACAAVDSPSPYHIFQREKAGAL